MPQLFACLVLRQFYNLDYHALEGLFANSPDLRKAIGLTRTPHRSTLCDAFCKVIAHEHVTTRLRKIAQAFEHAGLLRLGAYPATVDSSMFETAT